MEIALCQFDIRIDDKAGNKAAITNMLRSARPAGARWLIFPEMTLTGTPLRRKVRELDDQDISFFASIAGTEKLYVTFGGARNGHNTAITLDPGGKVVSEYSKIKLFNVAREEELYSPGAERKIFLLDGIRIMPTICFDLRFPLLYWDIGAKIDIMVNIANWPQRSIEQWSAMLAARAVENQYFSIGVNRTGADGRIRYPGRSAIYNTQAQPVLLANETEGIFSAKIDVETVKITRLKVPLIKT